jgi:hypothetical protein
VDWEGNNFLAPLVSAYAHLEPLLPVLERPRHESDHDNTGQDGSEDAGGGMSDHAGRLNAGSGSQESGGVADSRRGDHINAVIVAVFLILHIQHCEATIAARPVDGMSDVRCTVIEDKKEETSGEEDSHVAWGSQTVREEVGGAPEARYTRTSCCVMVDIG